MDPLKGMNLLPNTMWVLVGEYFTSFPCQRPRCIGSLAEDIEFKELEVINSPCLPYQVSYAGLEQPIH